MSLLFKNKDEAKQGLRVCSIVIIFLSMISALMGAIALCSGELRNQAYEALSTTEGIPGEQVDGLANVMVEIVAIALVATIALEWYIAIKGLKESRSEKQNGRYVTVMKVYLVFAAISVVGVAANTISRGVVTDWMAVVSPLVNTLLAFYFVEAAQTARGKK